MKGRCGRIEWGIVMTFQPLPEESLAAVHYNRGKKDLDRVQLLTKRVNGVLTDSFKPVTHGEFTRTYESIAAALVDAGLGIHEHAAIFSANRPRWLMAASGILYSGGVVVTVYPSLTVKEAEYIVSHSDSKVLFCGTQEQLEKALAFKDQCPKLEKIVVFEPMEDDPDGRYVSFDTFMKRGAQLFDEEKMIERVKALKKDDPAALIYTSGTTGVPKGVILSHGNLLSQRAVIPVFDFRVEDVWLSHLPFSHSFGFSADYLGCFNVGSTLAMAEGLDSETMRESMAAIRPTILISVPRLYEKLYVRVLGVLQERPKFARKIFWAAHKVGLEVFKYRNEGKPIPGLTALKYKFAGKLLGKVKVKAGMENLRVAYGGGGPLSADLMSFFQGIGIDIYQGYGLTETSPIATVTQPGNNKLGTVGTAIDDVEVKLDEDGEVLIRGACVMKEYYKNPEATAEAFTPDGWFRSGDIGEYDDKGRLMITDRKKELIITSAGKNIAPMPIETAFNTDPYIERVILIGDNRNYLTALVSPNFEILNHWAKEKGLSFKSDQELVGLPEVKALIQQRVDMVNADLARFETIKKFTLVDHEFSEDNGVLTPSQKVKRRIVNKEYKELIENMYAG